MRELTINECEAVAGGHGSGCMWGTSCTITDLTGITVIGQPGGGGGGYGPPPMDPGYGGGGGGGSQELPDCVSDKPAITNEDMFMQVVQHLTNELRGLYNGVNGNPEIDSSRYEYGAVIYEHNGQIGYGDLTTNNSPDYVNITSRNVPYGARIIAYMHNHPDQANIDDRVPSNQDNGDWDRRDDLINNTNLQRGITVDPNLLLVLYTDQDDKSRIYDKNDKNTNVPSCAV